MKKPDPFAKSRKTTRRLMSKYDALARKAILLTKGPKKRAKR